MKLDDVSKLIEQAGLPGRDAYDLPSSDKLFPDGAYVISPSPSLFPHTMAQLTVFPAIFCRVTLHSSFLAGTASSRVRHCVTRDLWGGMEIPCISKDVSEMVSHSPSAMSNGYAG